MGGHKHEPGFSGGSCSAGAGGAGIGTGGVVELVWVKPKAPSATDTCPVHVAPPLVDHPAKLWVLIGQQLRLLEACVADELVHVAPLPKVYLPEKTVARAQDPAVPGNDPA
jgi:hypothetical protein